MGDEFIEFMGLEVKVDDVKNPHLRRVITHVQDKGYKFGYNDHGRYSEHKKYDDYGDYREKYSEYSDTYYSDYDAYSDSS